MQLPITSDIMEQIKSKLKKELKTYQQIMMWAACCTAFFGFLCVSPFTSLSTHLSFSDVSLDNRHTPEVVHLHIKQLKTDPFGQKADLYLGRTHLTVCSVEALVSYLAIRGKQPGPLFILSDNTMLTRGIFADKLKIILNKLTWTRIYTIYL